MAAAQLHGGGSVALAQNHHRRCRLERLRSSELPFVGKPAEGKSLRTGRSLTNKRKQGFAVTSAACAGRETLVYRGYDVYELLGVEADAPVPEIKQAYRWLQKRCHPDIAGPIGHDMAILLNDAYAILSNPMLRAIYDVKRLERAAFDGYTGQPLYSKWFGPAEEDRAIFVDETQCVGCLKCALIASNTFAIENRYGRARAVGQWADSEATVNDAIRACPVDCISFVQREQLPALEFVMTKQPRVIVGVDMQTYGGRRNENVFMAAEKFLKKCAERELSKKSSLQETRAQKEARMAAAENIQARAGRWWHHFVGKDPGAAASSEDALRTSRGAIVPLSWLPPTKPESDFPEQQTIASDQLHALLEAARRRRHEGKTPQSNSNSGLEEEEGKIDDEYWSPMEPSSTSVPYDEQPAIARRNHRAVKTPYSGISEVVQVDLVLSEWVRSVLSAAPVAVSLVGAVFAGMTNGMGAANSTEVAVASASAGPLPAEVTSGLLMHMFLAAAVWYMMAAGVCGVAAFLVVSVVKMRREKEEGGERWMD